MSSPHLSRSTLNPLERDAELDPVSDPEPPAPSLPEPDPGVFHHEPATIPINAETKSEKDNA
jgi:hypothetical protein